MANVPTAKQIKEYAAAQAKAEAEAKKKAAAAKAQQEAAARAKALAALPPSAKAPLQGVGGAPTPPPAADPPTNGAGPPDTSGPAGPQGSGDWASYLTDFAIDDQEVKDRLAAIFRSTTDVSQAIALGLSYVRGTQWYARTYPGIFEAMAKGLVRDERDYRGQLNAVDQLYKQYYGRGVQNSEFTNYIKAGVSVDRIAAQLQGGAITETLLKTNPALANYFNESDLAKIGAQRAGLNSSEGMYLSGLYDYTSSLQGVFSQYGKAFDRSQAESLFKSNTDAGTVAKRFAGEAYIGANQNSLQYASGNFGGGRLTDQELKALGEQQAGIDTPLGNKVAERVARAQQRIQRVFDGVLASPSFTAQGGRLRSSQGTMPDLGA